MFGNRSTRSLIAGAVMLAAGCSSGMMDTDPATQLRSVSPRGGAVGVSATPEIVLTFTGPMMPGMEEYLALHQGGLTGPTMPMSCDWSDDQETLTCRPAQPLAPGSAYTIHMGGGMVDAEGQPVMMGGYGMAVGGEWATGVMMGDQPDMMDTGWAHGNGSYGMAFEFTTR